MLIRSAVSSSIQWRMSLSMRRKARRWQLNGDGDNWIARFAFDCRSHACLLPFGPRVAWQNLRRLYTLYRGLLVLLVAGVHLRLCSIDCFTSSTYSKISD
jgi:hypothetical protein